MVGTPKDFVAGLLFAAFGIAAVVVASDYAAGTAARMGPGYFPRILGFLLIALGVALVLRGLRPGGARLAFGSLLPAAIVLAAVALFGAAVKPLGLVACAFLLVAISARASAAFRLQETLVSGAVLATAAALIFVYGLGLPLAPWPTVPWPTALSGP